MDSFRLMGHDGLEFSVFASSLVAVLGTDDEVAGTCVCFFLGVGLRKSTHHM
jgi:hypothetical protein